MILKCLASLFTLFALMNVALAGVVKVDLNTGMILPGQSIVVSLNDLVPNHIYHLSCVLTSDHTSGNTFDLVQVTTPSNSTTLVVNAEETALGSHQYKLPTDKNTYMTGDITKEIGDITIVNLDIADGVLLSSCHAVGKF